MRSRRIPTCSRAHSLRRTDVVLLAAVLLTASPAVAEPTYSCEVDAPRVDGSGHAPVASHGGRLECLVAVDDTNPAQPLEFEHFRVFYNPSPTRRLPSDCGSVDCSGSGCERIHPDDAKLVGTFLECAWSLMSGTTMAHPRLDLRFDTPHGSPNLGNPDFDTVPIWIPKCEGWSAGGREPRITIPATKGLVAPGIDTNAFHEFAHLLFKSYEQHFNGGATQFINEGLPRFLGHVGDPRHDPPNVWSASGYDMRVYLSISGAGTYSSLRRTKYDAPPFWLYLAETYSELPLDESYPGVSTSLPCRRYLDHLDPPMPGGELYRIIGRDVLHALQTAFRECLPAGTATPVCRTGDGKRRLELHCAGEAGWPQGCIPHGDYDLELRGDNLYMPRALEIIDRTMETSFGLMPDGMAHQVLRDWLIHNGRLGGDRTDVRVDEEGYRLNAFGAHYHALDLSRGDRRVYLRRHTDLPRWAYAVYAVPTGGGDEVMLLDWTDDSRRTIEIPADPGYEKAVVVVAAFDGTYRADSHGGYEASGGHYLLLTDRDRPFAGNLGPVGTELDLAIYSPDNELWWIDFLGDGTLDRVVADFGAGSGEPLVGDFDGDGESELFHLDPATGSGLVRHTLDGPTASMRNLSWARPGWSYLALDLDCDGRDGLAAFDPATATWRINDSPSVPSRVDHSFIWGEAEALPFSGDFDRDGCRDDVGYLRLSDGAWLYDDELDGATSAELCCAGEVGDRPFAGDLAFDSHPDGRSDDVGVLRLPDHRIYVNIDGPRAAEMDGWHTLGFEQVP